jgi:FixJ family two-component response regulator
MKAGAFEFLTKPVVPEVLLGAIRHAVERSQDALIRRTAVEILRERFHSLSPREREVMELVATGCLNKQVGGVLGISEVTVKAHRGRVMRKMHASSLAQLVNMRETLETATHSALDRGRQPIQHHPEYARAHGSWDDDQGLLASRFM